VKGTDRTHVSDTRRARLAAEIDARVGNARHDVEVVIVEDWTLVEVGWSHDGDAQSGS
jgi:hypothetical protein